MLTNHHHHHNRNEKYYLAYSHLTNSRQVLYESSIPKSNHSFKGLEIQPQPQHDPQSHLLPAMLAHLQSDMHLQAQQVEGSFHLFPFLPKELRDLVWEYAATPFTPGVHFFELATGDEPAVDNNFDRPLLRLSPKIGSSEYSPNNASSYLDNLGVWYACPESRQRLEQTLVSRRHHLADTCGPILAIHAVNAEEDLPCERPTACTGHLSDVCTCSDQDCQAWRVFKQNQALLLNLEQDIVCFNLNAPEMKKCYEYEDGHPVLRLGELQAPNGHPASRLAIQWDPRWDETRPDGITARDHDVLGDFFEELVSYPTLPRLKTVYFIDYRITVRDGCNVNDSRPGVEVFQGGGKTFLEVQPGDERWVLEDKNPFTLARTMGREWSSYRTLFASRTTYDPTLVAKLKDDKWALREDEERIFKVLACVPSSR